MMWIIRKKYLTCPACMGMGFTWFAPRNPQKQHCTLCDGKGQVLREVHTYSEDERNHNPPCNLPEDVVS